MLGFNSGKYHISGTTERFACFQFIPLKGDDYTDTFIDCITKETMKFKTVVHLFREALWSLSEVIRRSVEQVPRSWASFNAHSGLLASLYLGLSTGRFSTWRWTMGLVSWTYREVSKRLQSIWFVYIASRCSLVVFLALIRSAIYKPLCWSFLRLFGVSCQTSTTF